MSLIGVDLGGTNTKMVRLNAQGKLLDSLHWRSAVVLDPPRWVDECRQRLGDWMDDQVQCLGLSVAGLVGESRTIENAPNLPQFEHFDFLKAFARHWPQLPVHLENDVHCAVFGENRAGVARGHSHVVMLSMGTGVGGGVILDGQLFRGARGMGAELGHTLLSYEGPPCKCGLRGHVEAYLGAEAMAARIEAAVAADAARGRALREAAAQKGAYSAALLSEIAQQGDALAHELWQEFGELLGLAFANLVHVFNPTICVVGGGVAEAGPLLLEPARRALRARRMRGEGLECELRAAALGPFGAAIGAALLAREQVGRDGA